MAYSYFEWTPGFYTCHNCSGNALYTAKDLRAHSFEPKAFYVVCPQCGDIVPVLTEGIPPYYRLKAIERGNVTPKKPWWRFW